MKKFTLLFNLIFLILVIYIIIGWSHPSLYEGDWFKILFLSLALLMPIVNSITLHSIKGQDWFSLYLRRKALEEENRISVLKGKLNK